ncbi:MAG: YHS domain-containing protein [Acidimicrobiia bacterium]
MATGIGFVDLAGFTALTEAHGDNEAADMAELFAAMAQAEAASGDRLVKSIGDAVLLQSPSGKQIVEFATRLMRRCGSEPSFPLARGGAHCGPIVARGGDVFGSTVNVAARIAAQAHGGQLLISHDVRSEIDDDTAVVDLGEFELRNVADLVHLFEVPLGLEAGPAGVDPVCRMRVERDRAAGRLRHHGHDYWFCSLTCAERFASHPEAFAP